MRKPIIAGNWKMFKTSAEVEAFIMQAKHNIPSETTVESVICVPSIYLALAKKLTEGTNLHVAAQNMHFAESGAFTGEISPVMLKDLGVDYVVIGHSERRELFNETDETVNHKVHAALAHTIVPIICVGESLEERESNNTDKVVSDQVVKALVDVTAPQMENVVIAYEPIWAIGTGKTATSDQAQETIHQIRVTLEKLYGQSVANMVRIQYGGSVKPDNVKELLEKSDIDGALVGGASLEADSFLALLTFKS